MKKNLLQILILLISYVLEGQSYKPLLVDGNKWNILYRPKYIPLKCGKSSLISDSTGTEIIKLSSDSTINGVVYKRLIHSFDSFPSNNYDFIREDSIAQKVYYIGRFSSQEILLYDFKVKIKDTVNNGYYTNIADTIDSIKIGTQLRKRIRLNNYIDWVEGIGAINGLITSAIPIPLCDGMPYVRLLLCFYNKDSLIYQPYNEVYLDCFYHTTYDAVRSINYKTNYILYPNPSNDKITIKSDNDEQYNVEITDIQGQILINKILLNQSSQISLQGIKSGIYFVRIINNKDIFIYKIIKE